jgi:hypothetical protein
MACYEDSLDFQFIISYNDQYRSALARCCSKRENYSSPRRKRHVAISPTNQNKFPVFFLSFEAACQHPGFFLGWFMALKMEAAYSSETSVHINTIRQLSPF